MTIKPVMPEDRERIRMILLQRNVFNQMEVEVALEVLDDYFRKGMESGYETYGFYSPSGLAGYICFGSIPMTDDRYDLYWIAVDEGVSQQGVGKALLAFMEKNIGDRGGRKIYVETSSTPPYHPARSFYRKNGYAVAAVLKEYYRSGDDKIVFLKDLPS